MKIMQDERPFNPITITLDTEEEAEAFWRIMREVKNPHRQVDEEAEVAYTLACAISNWFSNEGDL